MRYKYIYIYIYIDIYISSTRSRNKTKTLSSFRLLFIFHSRLRHSSHLLSERLMPFRHTSHLKPLDSILQWCTRGLRGLLIGSSMMPRVATASRTAVRPVLVESPYFQIFFAKLNTLLHTQRNIFQILSNRTEIRLYLSFFDWFWSSKRTQSLFCSKSIGKW